MYSNILVPVAYDHQHRGEAALAIARGLSEPDAKVTLLHVVEDLPTYITAQLPAGLADRNREEASTELRQIAANTGMKADIAVVFGHSGSSIVEFAELHECDCIVVASHRPGIADYFLGSTAARVVRHAHCAVHVMR